MKKYLIDLDGTLYSGEKPLPFAAEWMILIVKAGNICSAKLFYAFPGSLVNRYLKLNYTTPDHVLRGYIVHPSERNPLLGSRAYHTWMKRIIL